MSSVLGRWCLLVVLAIGVVAMHHTPFNHGPSAGSAQPVAPSPAGSSPHLAFDHADRSLAVVGGSETAAFSASPAAAEVKTGTGHGELHLCLAILPGAAAFLASLVLLATIPPASTSERRGGQVGLLQIRPPSPVLRRLAVLCVLRL